MRVVALETSAYSGSVAILDGDRLLDQRTLAPDERTAKALAPALDDLLRANGWRPDEVELVAVTQGPGSFTGLRVGVTTAKAFAYATGAQAFGVDTLEVIAQQAPAAAQLIVPLVDAQRKQFFAALWQRQPDGRLTCLRETHITDRAALLENLPVEACLSGPGLRGLRSLVPAAIQLAPEEDWLPQAATVGQLAYRRYTAGERQDLWTLLPQYYRRSAAEEKFFP